MTKKWLFLVIIMHNNGMIAQHFGRVTCNIPTTVTVFNNSPISALVTLSDTDGTGRGHPIKSGEIVQFKVRQSVNVIKVRGQPQLSNYNSMNDFRPLLVNVPYELKCANSMWEIYQRGAGGDTIFGFGVDPIIENEQKEKKKETS